MPRRKASQPLQEEDDLHVPRAQLPNELVLEIARYCDIGDVSRLTRSCRNYAHILTPILYQKDANEGDSFAITWAATGDETVKEEYDNGIAIMENSIRFGGDVNAKQCNYGQFTTALHAAAARGNLQFTKYLLAHGADVYGTSSDLWFVPRLGLHPSFMNSLVEHLEEDEIRYGLKHGYWLPILIPFLLGYTDVVAALLEAGAPVYVAIPYKEYTHLVTSTSITLLHLVAVSDPLEYGLSLIQRFPEDLDTCTSHHRLSPLHLAVTHAHTIMFHHLIEAGADIEKVTNAGRRPLTIAIRCCIASHLAQEPEKRKSSMNIVKELINAGTELNFHANQVLGETPLVVAMQAALHDWKHCSQTIKDIVAKLIDHGANINLPSSRGLTIVHQLCMTIFQKGRNRSLEDMLENTIIREGGDVNFPLNNGKSLLGVFIRDYNAKPSSTLRLLQRLGAKLAQQEVDSIFETWYRSTSHKNEDFEVLRLCHNPSPATILAAYEYALRQSNEKLFHFMTGTFPDPQSANTLVWSSLKAIKTEKMLLLAMKFSFNPNHVEPHTKRSYLHRIIGRLEDDGKEKLALNQIFSFLDRGTSVLLRDRLGRTALDQLSQLDSIHRDLLLTLHEAQRMANESSRLTKAQLKYLRGLSDKSVKRRLLPEEQEDEIS